MQGGNDEMIEERLDNCGKELKVSDQIRVKAGGNNETIEGRLGDWGKELKVSDEIRVKTGGWQKNGTGVGNGSSGLFTWISVHGNDDNRICTERWFAFGKHANTRQTEKCVPKAYTVNQ